MTTPAEETPLWRNPITITLGVIALVAVLVAGFAVRGAFGPFVPEPGSVDVGFAQDMTVHHRQAVEMASWERDRATDPRVRQLAFDIETTQNQQVGRMQGWLGLWDAPSLPGGGHMAWMDDPAHAGMSGMSGTSGGVATMPGMASTADLARLRATRPAPRWTSSSSSSCCATTRAACRCWSTGATTPTPPRSATSPGRCSSRRTPRRT
jgi:hypothetical protein